VEHFDDYALGVGRNLDKTFRLQGFAVGQPDPILTVGNRLFHFGEATAAAQILHRAIRDLVSHPAEMEPDYAASKD
jgi:hypothetical protein